MAVSTVKMTADQFCQLGEDPVGVRLELVDGEVAVSPSPEQPHSYCDTALRAFLFMHVDENDLGRVLGDFDTAVDQFNVRRPDILFFSKARIPLMHDQRPLRVPPDLCIEIISPGSIETDRVHKLRQYAQLRVPHYWIVDPVARKIEAYRLRRDIYELEAQGADEEVFFPPPFLTLRLPLRKLWLPKMS